MRNRRYFGIIILIASSIRLMLVIQEVSSNAPAGHGFIKQKKPSDNIYKDVIFTRHNIQENYVNQQDPPTEVEECVRPSCFSAASEISCAVSCARESACLHFRYGRDGTCVLGGHLEEGDHAYFVGT